MGKTIWVFPGQGAQYQGMLTQVPTHFFAWVHKHTGIDYTQQSINEAHTVDIQLATLMVELAALAALKSLGAKADIVAGHSLGTFAASVASGVMTEIQAITLVYERAQLMQQAFPAGYGMGVVVGLRREVLQSMVAEIHSVNTPVYLANQNSSLQTTLSGLGEGVDAVLEIARRHGATMVKRLAVPTPSHCVLMQTVADQLLAVMKKMVFKSPNIPYMANTTGRLMEDKAAILLDLTHNVAKPVQWLDMVRVCVECGGEHFIELPPGQGLTKGIKRLYPSVHTYAIAQYGMADTVYLHQKWRGSG